MLEVEEMVVVARLASYCVQQRKSNAIAKQKKRIRTRVEGSFFSSSL